MNHSSNKRKKQRLIVLCIAGFLALNYPLLSLFDRAQLVLGIPLLFFFLFIFWAFFIAMMALAMEMGGEEER
jgi:hypothetical protein